jgi:hypothetical protein
MNQSLADSDIYIYLNLYPEGYYTTRLIDSLYRTEDELWQFAQELETKNNSDSNNVNTKYDVIGAYSYYLEKYPTGKHAKQAKRKKNRN